MIARIVPNPPKPFDPLWETLEEGAVVLRCHELHFDDGTTNDGTAFNPGFGRPLRWSFFGDPPVPVHYSAESGRAAVAESILHNATPGAFIPPRDWRTKVVTALRVNRTLRLARLHSDGLRRLDVHARDLTDTDSDQYQWTVQWAQAAYEAGAEGLVWMSRQHNSDRAYCLFGGADRCSEDDLAAVAGHQEARVFATPADAEWLYQEMLGVKVQTRPLH